MSIEANSKINEYIDNVCFYVKYKEAHKDIKLELQSHIEDIICEYTEEGLDENEAIAKAIERMGNAESVGKQLNIAHKGTPDWITLILTLVLVNIGTILLYFMNYTGLYESYKYRFNHSLIYAAVGTSLIIFLYFFDYRKIEKYSKHIFFGACILCIFLLSTSVPVNGMPYIRIGSFSFDFIAVFPYVLIISLAGIFNNYDWNKKSNLIKALLYLIVPLFLMLLPGKSLTSCGIYFIAFLIIASKSGVKKRYSIILLISNSLFFVFYIFSADYRMQRFTSFLYPFRDPSGAGYTNSKIYEILTSISILGKGFSFDKYTLPCDIHSEFILNYVIYTFGLLGTAVILSIIICFILRIFHISKHIHDSYGKLLVNGILTIFIVQFVINILMNLNLFPIIGITLPFLSYGGSLCLFNMISIGIIMSVYRRRSLSCNKCSNSNSVQNEAA